MNAKEIRRIRKAMNLTQAQLAAKLGITSTSVARMERGEQKIMPVTTLALKYLAIRQSTTKGNRKT